ncbi:hypothetical protein A3194_05300 [Candidatus Thiodiazotropha endoloripes]|uniref:hypothetical protein n=1 Tax=Candidatus Thiodiazotropha endoloripes TaxID=1818881 RepID=UPI00083CF007|nr:hypothetical protein [Candidatus Thiodiazotropha endoloripes]ODB94077.1 hypothetical protein A3194_05300 [Candidatus Thiodiazotropha endoloripes]
MERLTPYIFWRHSDSFLSAAEKVLEPQDVSEKSFKPLDDNAIVAYYLVGHSIELSLKSYLYAKNYNKNKLRKKFGHDLSKLLQECKKRKIGREVKIKKNEAAAIDLLSVTYKSKKFEYLEYGSYSFPEYEFIFKVAKALSNGLARYAMNPPGTYKGNA